ncbi:MAG: PQQ-dependent dehydrogenase, methanol/ethanol family, partial [Gammaproteobacteria bacterium]|nr:PQQ-dependent dehydrogenase, methanol/ethanol family [Gammaproteobacteria bacterium]
KAPSGIIGNTHTWVHGGKQYIGVLSGIGGWAGAVVAFRKENTAPDEWALGAAGGYRALKSVSKNGGVLMVFAMP